MEIQNETPFIVDFTIGKGEQNQQVLTVIVKGTFVLPASADDRVEVAAEQLPLLKSNEFEDGITGSIRLESDLVPFKPCADILLGGHAYAPGVRPVKALDVALRVGKIAKRIRVFGDRVWLFPSRAMLIPLMSEPEPFTKMPLTYERAFGGIDQEGGDWCRENHLGRGLYAQKTPQGLHRKPLPNLEDPEDLITSWNSRPKPVCFGYYGRGSEPRMRYAGTYDEEWMNTRSPELPEDFSVRFHNEAHPDLQYPGFLQGDEEVELRHLTPRGSTRFRLPGIRPVVRIIRYVGLPGSIEEMINAKMEKAEGEIEKQMREADAEVEKAQKMEAEIRAASAGDGGQEKGASPEADLPTNPAAIQKMVDDGMKEADAQLAEADAQLAGIDDEVEKMEAELREMARDAGEEGEGELPIAAGYPVESIDLVMAFDTLLFLPDQGGFCQIWRGCYPLRDLDTGFIELKTIHVRQAAVE